MVLMKSSVWTINKANKLDKKKIYFLRVSKNAQPISKTVKP